MLLRLILLPTLLVCAAACGGSDGGGSRPPPETGPPSAGAPETVSPTFLPDATPRPVSFAFAAAGDHGANADTNASLAALDESGVDFYLALGDMDYGETKSDAAWCDYVHGRLQTLGSEFPFEVVSGNHEERGGPDGDILRHAACLPDRLSSTGAYAAQYYFDYPASSPLVRVIMIAPDLNVGGVEYKYAAGGEHYRWLSQTIDEARALGVPWVVVGMHKNCITTGAKECEIGVDLLNLLVSKEVDLILQAHDHNYQRSKQLGHGRGCAALEADAYDATCVVDHGLDARYAKGAGTVIVVSGTFGMPLYPVKPGDPEADYFAVIDATSHGFTRFTVTGDRIDAAFVPITGDLTDAFTIASE